MLKKLLICLIVISSNCYSSNGQQFDGINYVNPANSLFVKKLRFTGGSIIDHYRIPYTGTFRGQQGNIDSNTSLISPFLRLTYHPIDKLALGLAISEPYRFFMEFDSNTSTRNVTNLEKMRSVNIQPSLATKLMEKLWFGLGVNVTYYNYEVDTNSGLAFATFPGNFLFKGDDVAVSFILGAIYFLQEKTFLDLAFYTKSHAELKGFTRITTQQISTRRPTPLTIPNTIVAAITHSFNDKWRIRLAWSRSFWSMFNGTGIDLINTRVNVLFNYKDPNRYTAILNYIPSNNYRFGLFVSQDFAPINIASSNLTLFGDVISIGAIIGKQLTDEVRLRVTFGHGVNTSTLPVKQPALNSFGKINNRIYFGSIQLIYNIKD